MELTINQKIINLIFTLIQYFGFAIFLFWSPWLAKGSLLQLIELLGIVLALWAIYEMRNSKINIAPQPRAHSVLISSGPYRIIRHPMYMSIIIAITPLIISHWDIYRFGFLMFLYLNLILKMLFEEGLLRSYFSDYIEYSKKTWRIIPYIF